MNDIHVPSLLAGAASFLVANPLVHLAFGAVLATTNPPGDGKCSSAILYGAAYGLGYFTMQLIVTYVANR